MDLVWGQLVHAKIEMTKRYEKRSKQMLANDLIARKKNVLKYKKKIKKS